MLTGRSNDKLCLVPMSHILYLSGEKSCHVMSERIRNGRVSHKRGRIIMHSLVRLYAVSASHVLDRECYCSAPDRQRVVR